MACAGRSTLLSRLTVKAKVGSPILKGTAPTAEASYVWLDTEGLDGTETLTILTRPLLRDWALLTKRRQRPWFVWVMGVASTSVYSVRTLDIQLRKPCPCSLTSP